MSGPHFKLAARLMIAASSALCACSTPPARIVGDSGRAWIEGEELFRRDPRWLGADAALSIPLGGERTLWLFGDTFIAKTSAHVRTESTMVRNTVALQTGLDPRDASMSFHWQRDADGAAMSFFPERGESWYWPGHGVRLVEGPLVLFLFKLVATPNVGLGFASAGYATAVIDDPDAPIETWTPRVVDQPSSHFDALPANSVIRDGEHIIAVAIRQHGVHAGALVRYPISSVARGEFDHAEWWAGEARGWVAESELGPDGPAFVLDDAGAECSLHFDERTRTFVHVASYGFGASTIGVRSARAITGPWSAPLTVYRPPESNGPRPFVYAAKAHAELLAPNDRELVLTYATNSFEFADLFSEHGREHLYWPRFVLIPLGE